MTDPFGGKPLTPEEIKQYEANAAKESYPRRLPVAFDVFLNALTGGRLGETISSRCQRAASEGNRAAKFISWCLDKVQRRHGQLAQAGDYARAEGVERQEENSLGIKENEEDL
jgi:hypothetical protein